MSDKLKVTRRRLTFADHMAELDAKIDVARTHLEGLHGKRKELVDAEKARVAALQADLDNATK